MTASGDQSQANLLVAHVLPCVLSIASDLTYTGDVANQPTQTEYHTLITR